MMSQGPTLGRMAAVSLAFHLTLIALVAGSGLFQNRRFITPNPYFVDLVSVPGPKKSQAVRKKKKKPAPVKKVEPEKKRPPKSEKKPEKKVEKSPPPEEAPVERGLRPLKKATPRKPAHDPQREIERLKAIDRLRRLQALRSVVDVRRDAQAPEEPEDVTGGADTGERAHVYYGVVTHRVWEHWTYVGNPKPGWETLVYILLDDGGALLEQKIEASSGNEEFDRSVLRALTKAAPFPPPPEGIDRQIVFRFRP